MTDVAQGVDQFVGDMRDLLANPFEDWNRALNVGAVLAAFLLGFQVTRTAFVKPLVETVSDVFGVAAPVVTLAIGVIAGVVAAWIVYAVFASIWAKLAVLILGLIAVGVLSADIATGVALVDGLLE